ncbi:hypothetical protein CRM79_02980 [Pantoea agglomerans]|nr:hypothetical protein CRM79_02980 [Pantoea agglomerans]
MRNTVTLAFIAFSRSRRPVLIIEKIATITSVIVKKTASYAWIFLPPGLSISTELQVVYP